MRSVPHRSVGSTLLVLIGCLVAGPFLGLGLSGRLAPDSSVAQLVSLFAFPLAFFAGLLFWLGFGVVAVVLGALANLLRGRWPAAADLDGSEALVPPGYGSFVLFSLLTTGLAGLVVGLLSDASLVSALSLYAASGAGYGFGLRWLAHHGYLPFPEPG
ncbi:MAG: hypothetical protein HKP30_18025 [Myxococcales bacterium]|nr:hypothetical protein [Myxococcales bacterium]